MSLQVKIIQNWLTRPPRSEAFFWTALLSLFVICFGIASIIDSYGIANWVKASPDLVFKQRQYWRLLTTLGAHGDFIHLFGNILLFVPLSYLLLGYFSFWFFPLSAFLMGGLINVGVLWTLPHETILIGVSGVVYWMGGAWLTLFLLIDRRKNLKFRFASALYLGFMIFIPETYKPGVSYLSHFLGFILGIVCAVIYYFLYQKQFLAAEEKEFVFDETFEWEDPQWAPHQQSENSPTDTLS